MPKISLCMIAKDEEQFLRQSLESVKTLVDEIIIVIDDRSTDGTRKVAEEYGAKIEMFRWKEDFSAARNRSLELATGDWILVIDADEELKPSGVAKIKRIVNDKENNKKKIIGFALEQRTYHLKDRSRYIPLKKRWEMSNYTGYKTNFLVRLFKNDKRIRFKHKVHEIVEEAIRKHKGEIIKTDIVLHHFAALKGMEFYLDKIKMYTEIMYQQLKDDPENVRYLYQAGNIFFDNEEYDLALQYYGKAAQKNPNYRLIYSDIAQCHLKKGNIIEAIKNYNRSMKLKPDEPSAANNLAVLYMKLGKYEVAKKLLEKYVAKFPDNQSLRYNLTRLKEKIETRYSRIKQF